MLNDLWLLKPINRSNW